MQMKMKSSSEALSRECVGKKYNSQTIKQFRRSPVRNMLLKAVCLTSATLAVHSNIIEELQKFHELKNPRILLNY